MIKFKILSLALILYLFNFTLAADVAGSKDHPIIGRYPGSEIIQYRERSFDQYVILLGPLSGGKLTKWQEIEGKVTCITYRAPKDRSPYEVWKNYELAIKKAGFEILYTTSGKDLSQYPYVVIYKIHGLSAVEFGDREIDYRYLCARTKDGKYHLSLFVAGDSWGRPVVQLDIVESVEIELGLISVSLTTAENIKQGIEEKGSAVLYGIYFDFNSAEIKPESEPVLKELAKFLLENPDVEVYIVGHTDNIGSLEQNMDLSKRRAEAVVNFLVEKYGINPARLKAFGVGPLAPVASNDTEEGRAKNRRVEVVKR